MLLPEESDDHEKMLLCWSRDICLARIAWSSVRWTPAPATKCVQPRTKIANNCTTKPTILWPYACQVCKKKKPFITHIKLQKRAATFIPRDPKYLVFVDTAICGLQYKITVSYCHALSFRKNKALNCTTRSRDVLCTSFTTAVPILFLLLLALRRCTLFCPGLSLKSALVQEELASVTPIFHLRSAWHLSCHLSRRSSSPLRAGVVYSVDASADFLKDRLAFHTCLVWYRNLAMMPALHFLLSTENSRRTSGPS